MLRVVTKSLIMWDSVEASDEWIAHQVPAFLQELPAAALAAAAAQSPLNDGGAARGSASGGAGGGWAAAALNAETPPPATRTAGPETLGSRPFFPATPPGGAQSTGSSPPAVAPGAPLRSGAPARFGGWHSPSREGLTGEPTPSEEDLPQDVDWLLIEQTRASLVAGACLAIGLRFAGTGDLLARDVLVARLRALRDAQRSEQHAALLASIPAPGCDLDRATLDTCQAVVAMALGMVMAGTGDLVSLRILRSLRKKADLKSSYGTHMATHTAIGFVFLGGGKHTFDQDPFSTAALLMAAFPRFPSSPSDNRCHLQAFRHLYVLAARHRCVEAVDVETQQPADVDVQLTTSEGTEVVSLPRLISPGGDIRITLESDRYWPVTIQDEQPGSATGAGRWMTALQVTRRLYVKRRSGHLPHRLDRLGAQCAAQAWFPTFSAPTLQHVERLLQMPKAETGSATASRPYHLGGVALAWLQSSRETGSGPLEPGMLTVSASEWAAALCLELPPLLPPGASELDFEAGEDGSLCEHYGALVWAAQARCSELASAEVELQLGEPPHARFAHWLHECITDSKLSTLPLYLRVYLQTSGAAECHLARCLAGQHPGGGGCSALVCDQLVTMEWFYGNVLASVGTKHAPLLAADFLASRCTALRSWFEEAGPLQAELDAALRARAASGGTAAPAAVAARGDAAVALFCRLHGLPGDGAKLRQLRAEPGQRWPALLLRLRRAIPGASVQGLRKLAAALDLVVA